MRSKALAAALIPFVCFATGCTKRTAISQRDSVPETITQYGCPTCHVIPGVSGAVGKAGRHSMGLGSGLIWLADSLTMNPTSAPGSCTRKVSSQV